MRVPFRSLLHKNHVPIGGFAQLGSPAVIEIMAHCGYEFFIIDDEHGFMGPTENYSLIRTCDAMDAAALVRVSDISESEIKKALDAGATGLMIPNVHSCEDAKRAVQYARFAPEGKRGVCPFVRAANYEATGETVDEYCKGANAENYLILSIEGPAAVEDMEQILTLEGVDAISVGIFDLSVAMGIPGQLTHPEIRAAQMKMKDLSLKHHKDLIAFAPSLEDIQFWKQFSPDVYIISGDNHIAVTFAETVSNTRSELKD